MKEELQRIIGNNLYKIRNERHMTREQVAESAGISVPFYANLEAGNRMMSVVTLQKLAAVLNISADTLLHIPTKDDVLCDIVASLEKQPQEVVSLVSKLAQVCIENYRENSDMIIKGEGSGEK